MPKDKKTARFPLMEGLMRQQEYDQAQEKERQAHYEASFQGFHDKVTQAFSDIFGVVMVGYAYDMCEIESGYDAIGWDHEETPKQLARRIGLEKGFEPR
jgi:hypothetical protein